VAHKTGGRKPTPEQKAVLAAFRQGKSMRVTALAGSGKTTTLEYLALKSPDKKILYIAFNKSVQVEAEERFPRNVTCRTAHSLAFSRFGGPLRGRLFPPARVPANMAARLLGLHKMNLRPENKDSEPPSLSSSALYAMARSTVTRFIRSADDEVAEHHYVKPDGLTALDEDLEGLKKVVVDAAREIWEDISDPNGKLRCEQDVYLKLWAMSKPKLRGYDVIMVDEAQDTDPLLAQVIEAQTQTQIVVVGDENQAIYGWRGATSFITDFPAENEVSLTHSFRFGDAIAAEANIWLDHLGSPMRVVGNPAKSSTVAELTDPDAVLCRTNGGAMAAVMHYLPLGKEVALVGGARDLKHFVEQVDLLRRGRTVSHPDLATFPNWTAVQTYARTDEGKDLLVWVSLVETFGTARLLDAIDSLEQSENDADVVVSTVHKAKGRQWPKVLIWGDFPEPTVDDNNILQPLERDEKMLAYVAVTRAQDVLDPAGLAWIRDYPVGSI